jgi:translocation and assembly module TamA
MIRCRAAEWKKRAVLTLLLGMAITQLGAQPLPEGTNAARAAFVLEIQAPDEVRDLLQRHLELQRYRALTDLEDSELARLLTAAQQNARDLLATLGYFVPDIRLAQTPAEADGATPRRVTLTIDPGVPSRITEVGIDFTGPIADDAATLPQRTLVQAHWPLRTGMRFTQAGWDAAKQQALRDLTATRYPTGSLRASLADIDPETHSASLRLTLDSGPAYRLGPVTVSGLERHDASLVTRLARLAQGAEYDSTRLLEAQQRVADSGYFDSVFIALDTSGDPAAAPVRVQVREAKLQKLVLGVGASTDSGARLSAEHTHHKLPVIGWRALSKLSFDRDHKLLGTELTAPPDENQWRWVTSALLQQQHDGSFDVTNQRLRVGRTQAGERIDRTYYLQLDRARSAGVGAPETANAVSANYAWTQRRFDSLPFPSRGYGLGVELGGGLTLGTDRQPFVRIVTRWLGVWPLGDMEATAPGSPRPSRLTARAEAGAVVARDTATLPSTQRFLTGGDNTVRGYGYRDIGVTLPGGAVAAGRYMAAGSVEWQRPIADSGRFADWESTLFIDAGAVADRPAELRAKVGVGVGARWKSPVGPLQMDLAYGVAVKRLRLHLNVGFSF